jgi:hypothetical protein
MTRCKKRMSSSAPPLRNSERVSTGGPGRRRTYLTLPGLLATALAVRGAAPEPPQPDPASTLCAVEEKAYFSCVLGGSGKMVSLCGSADLHGDDAHLRYRFGRKGAIELEAPPPPAASSFSFFRAGGYTRARVMQWSIGFQRGHYHYELFDSRDGEVDPPFRESGIRVRQDEGNGKVASKVSTLRCTQPAFSLLGELRPLLKCDDALTFGGCKPE